MGSLGQIAASSDGSRNWIRLHNPLLSGDPTPANCVKAGNLGQIFRTCVMDRLAISIMSKVEAELIPSIKDFLMNETRFLSRNGLATLLLVAFAGIHSQSAVNAQGDDPCLYGDVNLDQVVNMADHNAWCEYVANGASPYLCEADGNYDGIVNLLDLGPFRDILLSKTNENFESNVSSGPSDFFWSTRNLGEGAVNEDVTLNMESGETETLYLYYTTNGPNRTDIADGVSINVATTNPGIITFDDGGSLTFPIEISGFAIGTRWTYPGAGQYIEDIGFQSANSVQDDLIIGITAMSLCQSNGILDANTNENDGPFVDTGYDPQADAFLFGKIEITALTGGQVNLIAGPNDLGIAHAGQMIQPTFSNVQIDVLPAVLLGDVNLDSVVNLLDVDCFVDRVVNGVFQAEADCNQDDVVDLLDVNPFVQILAGN